MADRCCVMLEDTCGALGKPCSRAGKIIRDGKAYCKQHDPQARKRRDDDRRKKWAAEQGVILANHNRNRAMEKFFEGVPTDRIRGHFREYVYKDNRYV